MNRNAVEGASRIVIKIGSSILTNGGKGLDHNFIDDIARQVVDLQLLGKQIVIVSSGAIAQGMSQLGWDVQSRKIDQLQTAASVGQAGLMHYYETCFRQHEKKTGQILIDHDDFANRERYLNARNLIKNLLDLEVIPIINENDSVSSEEIRFGDNDTLAALVSNLIDADLLILLTDKDGLYSADPNLKKDVFLINNVSVHDQSLDKYAGGASTLGRGGMVTKIKAARIASKSGCGTIIAGGMIKNILTKLASGEDLGTFLYSDEKPLNARKQWLMGQLKHSGDLIIDAGASKALQKDFVSLLPVGVKKVLGNFNRGELVRCISDDGVEVARGLINYSSSDARNIIGFPSSAIVSILGYEENPNLIDKDNLVVVKV